MNLISKKNTKKLIKGATYEAVKISTQPPQPNQGYFRPWVIVKINDNQIGFTPNSFTLQNGDDIPEMNWTSHSYEEPLYMNRLQGENLKVGDYIINKQSSCKSLEPGKIYKVSEVFVKDHPGYRGGPGWKEYKLKVEGSNIKWSLYNFRHCTQQEVRDIALKKLFDEKVDIAKAGEAPRIIDRYSPKYRDTFLLSLLINASNDPTRHGMSVLEWAVRAGQKQSVKMEDFTPILSRTIQSFIE
jgi:hypothetical protein